MMPLDYVIWTEIEKRMDHSAPKGTESKAAFPKRLERTAKTLPRGFLRKTVRRMKSNIKAIVDAKGLLPQND